jgi:methyl-accepting chemotaxis protein
MKLKFSLAGRLVALFALFGLLPLGLAVLSFARASTKMGATDGKNLALIANSLADRVDRNLFERYGDVQAFGTNEAIYDGNSWYKTSEKDNGIVTAMNAYVDLYDMYYLTILVDLSGKVVAVNSKDADGKPIDTAAIYAKNYKDAAWFKALAAGNSTSRQPYAGPGNDTVSGTFVEEAAIDDDVKSVYKGNDGMAIGFSAQVKGADGKLIGYWSNRAKFSLVEAVVTDFYKEMKAGGRAGTSITVLDAQGRHLIDYRPASRHDEALVHDASILFRPADRDAPSFKEVLAGHDGSAVLALDGQDTLVAGVRDHGALGFPGMNWSFVVTVPAAEAMPAAVAFEKELRWLTLLVSVAVLGLGLYVGRRFAKPIVAMTEASGRLACGDVNVKVDHQSTDETGALARALNETAAYVREMASGADAIARGDLDSPVRSRGESDVLSRSLEGVRANVGALVAAADAQIAKARDGELASRVDTKPFDGAYRRVAEGLNDLMSAVGKPLDDLKAALARVGDRDLSARMSGDYQGDYATVKAAMSRALENVEGSLEAISVAADQVATAATEISTGSQSLSQATTEQASSLEEVTASLQEITSMSRQNASNAQQARGMAQGASDGAERGLRSMQKLSEAVVAIRSHADQTAKIVKTIDEIAFQTNLLALNAAVEAARAGDAGKGFAVVAEEVRNLAMRSAEAAKTTSKLIEESVNSSAQGVALNGEVSAQFNDIATRVRKVVEVMAEIAAASEQQSRGVEQINTAIDEMSRVTQHNAATTEQSAAAAEELSAQSSSVQEMIRSFRLTNVRVGASTPQRRPSGPRPNGGLPAPKASPEARTVAKRISVRPSLRVVNSAGSAAAAAFPLDDDEKVMEQF